MTDIYVRRSDGPDPRRRAGIFLLVLAILASGGFAFYRFGCDRSPEDAESMAERVESDPLVDKLIERTEPGPVEVPSPPPNPEPDPEPEPGLAERGPIIPAEPAGRDPGIRLFTEARELEAEGALLEARDKALAVLSSSQNDAARTRATELLGGVGIQLVTTPHAMAEKVDYVVRPGDSLAKLAKKFNTTIELIQKSNELSGTVIRVGDRMRILNRPFRLEIDKSDNLLDLFLGENFFKRYRVGTGEYNKTPVGDFKITDRIAKPTWWRPDGKAIPYGSPENELGTHWLSLDVRHYGLHGTWEPETVGHQASAGCVRLINEEIEELFTLLPLGTQVTIRD